MPDICRLYQQYTSGVPIFSPIILKQTNWSVGIKLSEYGIYPELDYKPYQKLCDLFSKNAQNHIYCFSDDPPQSLVKNEPLYDLFSPAMIAKTSMQGHELAILDCSLIRMMSNSLVYFDAMNNFVSLYVSGYFQLIACERQYLEEILEQSPHHAWQNLI